MNADTCHGGLRPKRCLPAKFHFESCPLLTYPKDQIAPVGRANHASGIPKSCETIVTAPKRANSRFFTDCYPISAVFAPNLKQIAARSERVPALPRHPPISK